MKRTISIILTIAILLTICCGLAGCGKNDSYTVGICQLMVHDSLDQATQGFKDALQEAMTAAGKTVEFDEQVAGESDLCTTVVNTFTAKNVDLIMANATPALLAAANATTTCSVEGCTTNPHWHLLDGDTITVKDTVTKENMATAATAQLAYKAYAIQKDNTGTEAEAWTKLTTSAAE